MLLPTRTILLQVHGWPASIKVMGNVYLLSVTTQRMNSNKQYISVAMARCRVASSQVQAASSASSTASSAASSAASAAASAAAASCNPNPLHARVLTRYIGRRVGRWAGGREYYLQPRLLLCLCAEAGAHAAAPAQEEGLRRHARHARRPSAPAGEPSRRALPMSPTDEPCR